MEKRTDVSVNYSVVIPVFNGEKCLELLSNRIKETFKSITDNYEIIYVDDGSQDNSWKVLEHLRLRNKKIKIIKLTKNYGQHNATLCGLRKSNGEYIITLDQDLQHPPEEIPKLIREIKKGYSLVYAKYKSKKHGWFRNLGSRVTNKIISNITGSSQSITSFRILKREIVKDLDQFDNPNTIIDILFSMVISTNGIGFCPVYHAENTHGKSNYNLLKLAYISLNMIFNYTITPLHFASIAGILLSIVSCAIGLFFTIRYLFGYTTVRGFTALILTVSFLSGIILLVLGIIGEYIGRIFLIVTKKPQYKIKRIEM